MKKGLIYTENPAVNPTKGKGRPAMVIDPCLVHGESTIEQVQRVLSKLSDEDLMVLADADPNVIAMKVTSAVSTVAGTRFLSKIRDLKAQHWPSLR